MRSTLASTLPYCAFMLSILLPALRNRPARPFFSSPEPKPLSCTTSSLRSAPTSPRSLLRTLLRAFSEKPATLFWAAAPYCSTRLVSVMSIFLANSSTAFFSCSVRSLSSSATGSTCFSCGASATAVGSRVSSGTATSASVGFRVSSGVIFSLIVCSSLSYF